MTEKPNHTITSEDPQGEVVTAVDRLQQGQNFFDQYPFDNVFKHVSGALRKKTGRKLEDMELDIAHITTWVLRYFVRKNNVDAPIRDIKEHMLKAQVLPRVFRREQYRNGGFLDFRDMVGSSFAILDGRFQDWRVYVVGQRDSSFYQEDGTYHPTDPVVEVSLPQSYLSWIAERQLRESRIPQGMLAVTISEGFPVDRGTAMRTFNIRRTRGINQ